MKRNKPERNNKMKKEEKKDKVFQIPEAEVITFENEVVANSGCPDYECSGVCTGNCKKIK